jgi:uncharacterized membrane protein YhhN
LIPAVLGVFAAADWVAVARRNRPVEYFCKPAVMVALIGAALWLEPQSTSQRGWFVAALVFSLAGDVFLMLPPPRDRFVFGLGSFLVAHLFYVAGLAAEPGGLSWPRGLGALQVLAVLGVVVGGPILRAASPRTCGGPSPPT